MSPRQSPLQQSAGFAHGEPGVAQRPPHSPFTQALPQHSSSVAHAAPCGVHTGPQMPSALQFFEQQSDASVQPAPSVLHVAAHRPPSQLLLQHSVPAVHGSSRALQTGGAPPLPPPPLSPPSRSWPRAPQAVSAKRKRRAESAWSLRSTDAG
jgi:hypothetical protein